MTEFNTTAVLDLEVPSSELRNVRQQIESELGATEIGVSDGGSMSAQTARTDGGTSRERRWRRREFRWARDRTEYLEEAVVYLEEIEDKVGGDGAAGGILNSIIGAGGDVGGAVGGVLGEGAASAIGSAVGSAVGTSVGNALSDQALAVETEQFSVDIATDELDEVAVGIETEQVEDVTVGVRTEELETVEVGVRTEELEALELSVETPDPFAVEQPVLPVAAPEFIPVRFPDRAGGGGGSFLPDSTTGADPAQGLERVPVIGRDLAELERDATRFVHDLMPGASAEDVEPLDRSASTEVQTRGVRQPDTVIHGRNGARRSAQVVEQNNEVRVGDVNVDAEIPFDDFDRELDDLEADIMDRVEDRVEDAMDELRRELRGR